MVAMNSVLGGAIPGAQYGAGIFNQSNQGMAPNNLSTYKSLDEVLRAAAPYGQGAINKALASYNSQQSQVPMTTSDPWLSADQLRAKTNALQSDLSSGFGSGGGGGGGASSGGMGGGSSGGGGGGMSAGGLGGLLGGAQNYASPSGLGGFPNVNTGSIGAGQIGVPNPGQSTNPTGLIPANQIGTNQGLPMMQMGANNALQQYYNTPGYQLTNGQGAVNNFQTSPGYQFAVNEALKQVQQQGASRGLLDSGAGLRAMTDRAQGMANQEFNNWQQNQQNQFNQYQNRLQGLASGPTGADMAYGLGQNVGNNAMQTGSNVGSILANQGNSLFGGLVGAGGAQAQNVTQAGNMQAQILGSNLQTQMMLAALAAGRPQY